MKRVQSVDFLRGLTILLMILVNTPGNWSYVYTPLLHADWNGLTLADFVFPFFLYIVGISISFVYRSKQGGINTYKKIYIRSAKLIGLGLLLNVFLPYFPFINIESIRIPGVLQRIGIVFCITSILYLNFNKKTLFWIGTSILILYWIWLSYIPLPDGGFPTLERSDHNWANYLDYLMLKGHTWKPDYDPEGILSTLPAIVSAIAGTFIGEILISNKNNKLRKFIFIGSIMLLIGYLWSIIFPINKALWSSSFVLVTSGYATLLLGVLHYLMDNKELNFGNIVKYVGANAIIIYFLSSLLAKSFYLIEVKEGITIHQWIFENIFVYKSVSLYFSSFIYAGFVVVFYTILAYYLYRKKIFFKV
ncbi:heparan-alpha-glucosaminide N-acetyltransferase [Aquimarina sp. 2201CG5-10]|uniref:acyltransferase family protein n=1 Tax=Aquimarina callyspongiae TaxID=3098150 RepID=UPI002AB4EB49|nr:heparan-alpha-glucosaminide N-acetyltransferase [Aquimarina sp. 2201CG5-10]MDY8135133.1 heparan-alpha-glucosaminide N-acetyltransferase [Aquimarina sp. 2201CG5-10]